jgi:hypothetical protein
MISGNERLIVVFGMAHSGTTILTYVLNKHPETMLAVDGEKSWILENTWLPLEQGEPIQGFLATYPNKRLLLKRPWNEVWHGDWMRREMPNAKFIYCYRDFDEITKSWSKPTSFVNDMLRSGGIEYQRGYYQFCLEKAEAFARAVPFFYKLHHPRFVEDPKRVMAEISAWAGLAPFKFDVSQVSCDKNIKDVLYRV